MGVIALSRPAVRKTYKDITLNVNNTTGSIATFTVTGAVQVHALYGFVTTVFSSNVTAAHFRLNDQTATVDMTLATGVNLSSLAVGSMLIKDSDITSEITALSSAAGQFSDSFNPGGPNPFAFLVQKKSGATTTIDFRYTTTNAPSSGVFRLWAIWEPMSEDGALS